MDKIMSYLLGGFLVIGIALVLIYAIVMIYKIIRKDIRDFDKKAEVEDTDEPIPQEEKYPYVLNNPIMSAKEKSFYRAVLPIANELGLTVFSKIRIADLLKVPNNISKYQTWFNRIKAKHVDFVLVDSNMNIKVIIEVDDRTHSRDDRKQRDNFVDNAFGQLGLEVLHIYSWGNNYGGVDLRATITKALQPKNEAASPAPISIPADSEGAEQKTNS